MRTALLLALLPFTAPAAQDATDELPPEAIAFDQGVSDALAGGRAWLRFRYRFENVDQPSFAKEANASTLRTVLGYESALWQDFRLTLEFEDVTAIGEERYNSLSNGMTEFPVVPDPTGGELNQLMLEWRGIEDTRVRLGRQLITFDNQRFISNVGWRQNEQTYDALAVQYSGLEDVALNYAYLSDVHRGLGSDHPLGTEGLSSHLVNAGWQLADWGKLSAYAYLLEFDSSQSLSTSTLGLRFAGERPASDALDISYEAEFADQSDHGNNPLSIDAQYAHAGLGARWEEFSARIGFESFGGSGVAGDKFTTPFALLHGFNGWADQFLTTPDTGLEDTYASLQWKRGKYDLQAWYHYFAADSGGADYGSEVDLLATYAVTPRLKVGAKYAAFDSDGFSEDTDKLWGFFSYSIDVDGD